MSGSAGSVPPKPPSRHVLLVLDAETADPEEVAEAIRTFGGQGSALTIASEGARPVQARVDGAPVQVDIALEDVQPEDYDLPVVVGSASATARLLQHPVVKKAFENLQVSQWDRRIKAALLRVSHAAMRARTDAVFAEAVVDACGEILADPVALLILDEREHGGLRVAAAENVPNDLRESVTAELTAPERDGLVARALRDRSIIHDADVEHAAESLWQRHGVREIVAAPLVIAEDEDPLGALVVGTRATFTAQDRERVDLIARECADALHRRHLMRRVEALARERGLALARLRAAHAELEDFAYSVSHDLSEPLRGICTLTSYVRQDLEGKIPPEDEEMLAKVHAAGDRLKDMVAGLLAVTRAMKTAPVSEGGGARVDMQSLVNDCIVSLAPSLEEKDARVEVVTPLPPVRGERVALEQILLNLVANALKHNDKPEPLIEIGCEDAGHEWRFFVRDNGPGIPQEYKESVFRVYARMPAHEASGGVGIGLALVRKLVDRQGGRVWVESEPGAGATFYFTCAKVTEDGEERTARDAETAPRA